MTPALQKILLSILRKCAPIIKNDELYLRWLWRVKIGTKLNLKEPKTFNEKLQWLKLYDRNPKYTTLVDKYAVKEYVSALIGEEHIIPTIGVWNTAEEIDFNILPARFVLKPTGDSGGRIICRDKSAIDISKVKTELTNLQKRDYFWNNREWPYKNVPKRILAEQYMEEAGSECLTDYKWFCFNGEPKVLYISKDAADDPHTDFFDMQFNRLPIRMKDPNSIIPPSKPAQFEEMKEMAKILSRSLPEIRVDFYVINCKVYFGELTFFHNSGLTKISPDEWDLKMGEWISLPINR